MTGSLRRHARFYGGLAAGAAVAALAPLPVMPRLLAGADVLFAVYLLGTWWIARRLTPDDLRRHARDEDEGMAVLLVIALGAVAVSLTAIFDALEARQATLALRLGALASVPLGWATLHTLFAFRYAHLWYAPEATPDTTADPAGDGATPAPGWISAPARPSRG